MGLQQNRRRLFVKGLGTLEVRETDPSAATEFSNVGFLKSVKLSIAHTMVEVVADTGVLADFLPQDRKMTGVAELLQSSKDELDLLRNAIGKLYSIRYSGLATPTLHQTWVMPVCRIQPDVALGYKPGERTLPLLFAALNQLELGFSVPEHYLMDRAGEILINGLHLWTDPREYLNGETAQLLDLSGFERRGTVTPSGRVGTIWVTSAEPYFLRFDGTQDYVTHGNVLNDDGSGDFVVEAWLRVQAANGTQEEILSKKAALTDNTAGYSLYRLAANTLAFRIGSGSASAVVTTTGTVLQNVWKHVLVAVDRNGNATIYVNGSADGTPVSMAAIGTGTNSTDLYIARCATGYGQIDTGGVRIYRFAAGALPANIATVAANHYNAERSYYGL